METKWIYSVSPFLCFKDKKPIAEPRLVPQCRGALPFKGRRGSPVGRCMSTLFLVLHLSHHHLNSGPWLQEHLCQRQGDALMGLTTFTTSPALMLWSLSELSAVTPMVQMSFPKEPVLCQLSLHSLCVQLYSFAEISYFIASHC